MSTGDKFSDNDMNYTEENWEELLENHLEKQKTLAERKAMITFGEFLPRSLKLTQLHH